MSLKAFHVFFILVSILLCFGVAAWVFAGGAGESPSWGLRSMGLGSAILGLGLLAYSVFFIRKARQIII